MKKIQDLLKEKGRLSFGKDRTLKLLKSGQLAELFVCSNYPNKTEIKQMTKIADIKVEMLTQTNEELGALCKKPFSISIIGLKKE